MNKKTEALPLKFNFIGCAANAPVTTQGMTIDAAIVILIDVVCIQVRNSQYLASVSNAQYMSCNDYIVFTTSRSACQGFPVLLT